MFITWVRESLAYEMYKTDKLARYAIAAKLSRSQRINGQPRRFTVASLGRIEEAWIGSAPDQAAFWFTADIELAHADLADEERERHRMTLAARVPRPDLTVLNERDAWVRLLKLNPFAAERVLPELTVDKQERRNREQWCRIMEQRDSMRTFLRDLEKSAMRIEVMAQPYESAWLARTRAQREVVHRLGFDYSQLDSETAATVKETTARMHDLA